jgi:hypothetical protein
MSDDFRAILNSHPFKPFRICMSNGEHIDVRHPEMATVLPSVVRFEIGGPSDEVGRGWYNLIHVVKIVELNGRPKRRRRRKPTA